MFKKQIDIETHIFPATALVILLAVNLMTTCWIKPVSAAEQKSTVTVTQTLHKTINIDGVEIFYREAGPVEAPTILLLHGLPEQRTALS